MSRWLPTMNQADTLDDLEHGQAVIVAARWVLVVAGLLLALWNPSPIGDLRIQIVFILGLAVANFILHTRLLTRKTILAPVVYGASAADIAVVSILIISQGGFQSNLYVFYFPAIMALSVAFPTKITAVFTGAAIAVYGLTYFATADTVSGGDAAALITRLLILAAVAVCGNVYWRIEGNRRRTAAETREAPQVRVAQEGLPR